jgi:pimeloyl-ACP methyl ester carboxylesterase
MVRPGLDLQMREAGHGSPVLLLHGAGGPAGIDTLFAHVAGDRRVIAPTKPSPPSTTSTPKETAPR